MDTFQPPPPLLPDLVTTLTSPGSNSLNMADNCSSGFQSNSSSAWPPATPCPTSSFNVQSSNTFNEYSSLTCLLPPLPSPPQPAGPVHVGPNQISQPPKLPDIEPDKVVEEFEKIMDGETDRVVLTNSICLLFTYSIDFTRGVKVCQDLSASPKIMDRLCYVLTDAQFKDDDWLYCATGSLFHISKYDEGRVAILDFNGIHNSFWGEPSWGVKSLFHSLQSSNSNAVIFAITAIHYLLLDGRAEIQEKAKQQIKHGLPYIVQLLDNQLLDNCLMHNYVFKMTVLDCLQILAYGNSENRLAIQNSRGPYLLLRTIEENLNNPDTEELLETASRVLKLLSVCPKNKFDIIERGGIRTLTVCITKNNHEILKTCLWTLRNLSDIINNSEHVNIDCIEKLAFILLNILKKYSEEPSIITCALGVLYNLTCNNEAIKQFICSNNGIYLLLQTIAIATRNGRDFQVVVEILEPAIGVLCNLMNQNNQNQNLFDGAHIIMEKFNILEASMISDDLAKAVEKLGTLIQPYLQTYTN